MAKRTALYDWHVAAGARMVGFAGWEMPLHYGSQVEEHHRVRRAAGMFDVSHMTVVDILGDQARPYLRFVFANDVGRLQRPGGALYTCMLNEQGGVIDDLLVYFQSDDRYRLVLNAATREKDLAWLKRHAAPFRVSVEERQDLAMIAVQGPQARARVLEWLPPGFRDQSEGLAPFQATWQDAIFMGRTGYTGEDGFEVMLPNEKAVGFVDALYEKGVAPAGLGARDTLRLEAGLNLYGTDMDESVSPFECGLAWTVAWAPEERGFIGRRALDSQKRRGPTRVRVGLVLEGRGVLRNHQEVYTIEGDGGEVTSGGFSPTLGRSIALARVPAGTEGGLTVGIRGKRVPARVVKPPFVRQGESCIES